MTSEIIIFPQTRVDNVGLRLELYGCDPGETMNSNTTVLLILFIYIYLLKIIIIITIIRILNTQYTDDQNKIKNIVYLQV